MYSKDRNRARLELFPSMTIPAFLRIQGDDLLLTVKLQPRASITQIGDPPGPKLRNKAPPPPVAAPANEPLTRLLSEHLDIPRNRIELIRGHASRHKVLKLYG